MYAAWTNDNNIPANLLTGISYPQGGNATTTYEAASQFMNASGTPVNTEPYPVYVVSKIATNDGLGNISSSTYQYASGTYYYGSPTDHEFAGFGLVTETDSAGNVTKTYYDTSNGVSSSTGQYNDNFWKIGKPYRVENYDNAGNLYKVLITKWDSTSTGSNAAYVFPDTTLEMDYDGLSTHEDSAESYTWNEAIGNETQKVQWGQVGGNNNGTFTTSTSPTYAKSFQVNTLSGGTLPNGLVSYWNLNGSANDFYGFNSGTDTNAPYSTSYGKVGEGAEFDDGSVKYIAFPSGLLSASSSAASINLWYYATGTEPTYATILAGQSANTPNGGYWWSGIGATGSNFTGDINGGFNTVNNSRVAVDSGVGVITGAWTMVTITYDGSYVYIYVNGVYKAKTAATGNIQAFGGGGIGPLYLGTETEGSGGSSDSFGGYIDEPSIWNRALTANEITELYNGGAGQTMVTNGIPESNEYITNISYASSTSSTVIGKISDETLLDQTSTKIQETQYYYDGLALGSVGAGNLTTQDDWITSSTYATTTRNTYNTYGLVTQTLDPRNNTTTYAYDSYNLYSATTTNALGQTTSYQYDYSTGKPTQTIDPNGLKFKTTYDGLGRPLQVFQPDSVTTSTEDLKTVYTYTDTSGAVSVEESDYLNGSTTVNTYSYYDGLNRLIQTRKSATDAGIYKVTDQSYNPIGLTTKESLPYFGSGASSTSATTTAALFTNYTYDPLGRVLTTENAVGTTTDAYDNWETKITDPNGNEKDEFHDAYGNLIQVGEHNGTSTYTTYYGYDGLKDLLGITDANGNVRNFSYDGLGREVSSTDLHGPASSTYGIWNYTYDNAGNLTQRLDPKNQTTTYTYDALNRVLTESEASTTQIAYTYDSCTNGIGRLCSVSSTDAVSLDTKTYDPEGNLASETKTINATNYVTSYTYDRQGNQLTITNPDGSEVEYTYGTGGLVTNVQEKESGGSFANIVTSLDYSPTDQVTSQSDANGITTTSTYNAAALYRLSSILTTNGSSTAVQSSTYTYDNDGNITKVVDGSATNGAITVNYTYDGLNRLLTASSSNAASGTNYLQTFTYNPVGNILSGPNGPYTYNGGSSYTDPDAVTSIGTSTATGTSTISFVQTYQSTTGGTSVTSTMTGVGAGDLLIVENGYTGNMTSSAITDNAGTLTFITSSTWHGNAHSALYYEKNAAAGSHSFHTSYGSTPSYPGVSVIEYSGANTSTPLDTFTTATGTGDPVTAPTMTSTEVNELAVAYGNAAGVTLTAGTGFTLRGSSDVYEDNATSTMAAGTAVSTTFSGSSGLDWIDQGELIKPVSGGTSTSTTSFSYDNDGNLVSSGNATDTWDYRNELLQVTNGSGSSTYGYDYTGQRAQVTNGTSTTYYPETTYSVSPTGITKNIFANGALVSTIQSTTSTPSGYQYYRSITVTSTASIASGTNANFPMLVSSTLASWATVAHGGHVQNLVTAPNGIQEPADLIFATSSANCNATSLKFETASYSSSTGALVDWVNVPSVSTGTIIYACYDNSAVSTDQSHPSSTWNSNYKEVFHLSNGTTLNASDTTGNATSIAINGATANAGYIAGGAGFASSSHQSISFNGFDLSNASFTVELWQRPSTTPSNYALFSSGGTGGVTDGNIVVRAQSNTIVTFSMYADDLNGTVPAMTNNWNFTVVTLNASKTQAIYQNGAYISSRTASGFYSNTSPSSTIGQDSWQNQEYTNGSIDEVRVLNTALTPSWILSEYNNQNSPSTFYTVGSETATGGSSSTASVDYISNDNLGGTNVVTNASDTVVENLSYFPYGQIRIDNTTSSYNGSSRKYIGQLYDGQTQLDYLNARYYNPAQGQFISEDPVFIAMGSTKLKNIIGSDVTTILSDPQVLNSYSYASDNPIANEDPSGLLTASQAQTAQKIINLAEQAIGLINQEAAQTHSGGGGGSTNGPTIPSIGTNSNNLNNYASTPSASQNGNNQVYNSLIVIGVGAGGGGGGATYSSAEDLAQTITDYTAGNLKQFTQNYLQSGINSLLKSKGTFEDLIDEHLEKVQDALDNGGYTSSMENELENFQRQINAINQVLQNPPPVVQDLEGL